MHAAADARNVSRSILVYLAGQLPGAEVIPADDLRGPDESKRVWVRVSIDDVSASPVGRNAGYRATRTQLLLRADVFVASPGGSAVVAVDESTGVASQVCQALRYAAVPILDYVTSPTAPDAVTGYVVRFLQPPTQRGTEATVPGWIRRVVSCEGEYFALQAA